MEENKSKERESAKIVIGTEVEKLVEVRLVGESMTIGREGQKNTSEIQVDSSILETVQGKFIRLETGYAYQSLSKEKTAYLNDCLLETGENTEPIPLKDGDIIRFSDSQKREKSVVVFFRERFDEKEEWRRASLEDSGMKFHISRHEEADGAEEVQTDLAALPRHYATLLHNGSKWTVADHNTKYGVFVNNCRIDRERVLADMDVIRIGNTAFFFWKDGLYYNHKETSKNKLVIHIEERSVWNLFRKKVLLEDIDLTISPGNMVLILGGSGAGKTTFVNAVMGYEKAKGKITEGDRDIYRDYNQMKYEIGFVPQQDLLRLEDSVYDTLLNAAELKMPKNVTAEEKKSRVREVLATFGLEREEKSLVEKLSGGQRKRLSIAVEFIAKPSLFFLDEPDSGLDGVMARFLMENLRKIADDEKIVLVITHSPDRVADLFDKVIVLAKSQEDNIGHMAFYGSVQEAREFFETDSLEGIVKLINREDEGGMGQADTFIKKYEEIEKRS